MLNKDELDSLYHILQKKVVQDKRTATLIAAEAKVSQPTVSRIKSGKSTRVRETDAFSKLCKFYHIPISIELQSNVVNNKLIQDAINTVWDGSDEHAEALAKVILSLRGIMKPQSLTEPGR
ncbi:MAG: hypothetical protein Q8Q57_01120 [Methylotenera sp.]|nr:hypothetical protein [Methylotenera sp.]